MLFFSFSQKREESKEKNPNPVRQKHGKTIQNEVSMDYTKCSKEYKFWNVCINFLWFHYDEFEEIKVFTSFFTDITFKIWTSQRLGIRTTKEQYSQEKVIWLPLGLLGNMDEKKTTIILTRELNFICGHVAERQKETNMIKFFYINCQKIDNNQLNRY